MKLVGLVAYLDERSADRALEVHAALVAEGVRSHLVVAGDGPMRPALEADVRRRRLEDTVTLLGRRLDVEWILAGLDVLVITSDREGIPGVAVEALMAGCPVVTVPVGGVAEVVENGVTGLVLADADPNRMAEAVVSLLGDEPRILSMRQASRGRIERFSVSDHCEGVREPAARA